MLPSPRVTVPTRAASTPVSFGLPSVRAGGQIFAHLTSQLDFDGLAVSASNLYSTQPPWSVTTLPIFLMVLALSCSVSLTGAAAGVVGAVVGAAVGWSPAPARAGSPVLYPASVGRGAQPVRATTASTPLAAAMPHFFEITTSSCRWFAAHQIGVSRSLAVIHQAVRDRCSRGLKDSEWTTSHKKSEPR